MKYFVNLYYQTQIVVQSIYLNQFILTCMRKEFI